MDCQIVWSNDRPQKPSNIALARRNFGNPGRIIKCCVLTALPNFNHFCSVQVGFYTILANENLKIEEYSESRD